jgi:hypothetical protein
MFKMTGQNEEKWHIKGVEKYCVEARFQFPLNAKSTFF